MGFARRGVSVEGKAVMPSRCMVVASGGKRHVMKEEKQDLGVQSGRLDFVPSICYVCVVFMSQRLHEHAFLVTKTESECAFRFQWRGVTLS